jgi:hypothetical protein
MEVLSLNCWVRGPDVGRIFEVKISMTETVAALKNAIRNEKPAAFRDVDADTLDLYRPRDPVGEPYKENLNKLILSEHAELLEIGLRRLSKVFPNAPPECDIHIIVGM